MFKELFTALFLQFVPPECPMVQVVDRVSIQVEMSSQEQYYGVKLKFKTK